MQMNKAYASEKKNEYAGEQSARAMNVEFK